ncbi:hypothetical protein CKAH01_08082 [Colletotrichum kahawae]|uniref:Uncharacterized protein n=1 Tax=Colletotrichum kahawae TaxID=34407 RepID=A0AAD9Y1V1_COLKA|nr:hypothetical protein CKAH01_08082 [Colletotrichum kahawae]
MATENFTTKPSALVDAGSDPIIIVVAQLRAICIFSASQSFSCCF